MSGIIVGIDGSSHSQLALEWAMRDGRHPALPAGKLIGVPYGRLRAARRETDRGPVVTGCLSYVVCSPGRNAGGPVPSGPGRGMVSDVR